MRSPAWTRDEIVLVCAAVVRNGWRELRESDPVTADLSRLLRALPIHPPSVRPPDFRSVGAVSRKSTDIVTAQPGYTGQATKGGEATRRVVEEFLEEELWMLDEADEIAATANDAEALRGGASRPEVEAASVQPRSVPLVPSQGSSRGPARQSVDNGSNVDRARRLFQFLARVQELKSRPVRSVDGYREAGGPLWLSSLPDHDAIELPETSDAADEGLVLRVQRVHPQDAPELPSALRDWVIGRSEDPDAVLELRSRVHRGTTWDESSQREIAVYEELANHPEVRQAFDRWHQHWSQWAERERRERPVRAVYERLFRFHAATEGRAEEFELLLGVGLLAWETADGEPVRRHLCTVSVTTVIDDRTGQISVFVDDAAIGLRPEIDMIDPVRLPNRELVQDFELRAREYGEHPLDEESFAELAQLLVHHLDATGAYRGDWAAPQPSANPLVAFAPAILLRKRTQLGMQHLLERVATQIEEAGHVPAGLLPLVDPGSPPAAQTVLEPGALLDIDGQVFSPLPLNEVQRKILARVDSHAQVLVQGPPGTGKTHTAAALLSHLLAQGRRVLVTAQTDRALEEVRNKLPEQIKPLAVSVIGASRSDMADLKLAVDTIARRASDHDPESSEASIARAMAEVESLRHERLQIGRALREAREKETEKQTHDRYEGTPATLARIYEEERRQHEWIQAYVVSASTTPCPVSDDEALRWLELERDEQLDRDRQQAAARSVEMASLMDPHEFARALRERARAEETLARFNHVQGLGITDQISRLSEQARVDLNGRLTDLARRLAELSMHPQHWVRLATHEIRAGTGQVWIDRYVQLDRLLQACGAHLAAMSPGVRVDVLDEPGKMRALAQHLREYLTHSTLKVNPDGTPKAGWVAPTAVKQARPLFDGVRVNGVPPTSPIQLNDVIAYIDAEYLLAEVDRIWPAEVAIPREDTVYERFSWHRAQHALLASILSTGQAIADTNMWLDRHRVLRPNWADDSPVAAHAAAIDAIEAATALERAAAPIDHMRGYIASVQQWDDAAEVVDSLADAIELRDANAYAAAYARARELDDVRSRLAERQRLRHVLIEAVPRLALAVAKFLHADQWRQRLGNLNAAWSWRTLGIKLVLEQGPDVNVLQSQLEEVDLRLREKAEHIAAARAWNHAVGPQRLTLAERPKLTQYSQLVARLGKGTGRYAARQRAEIRQAMDRCRPLVPVWIMPLYRIAEQIDVQENLFDVVLIDEASQAGTEAVFLQYLAKTVVVIGDDKQVSPVAVGIDQEQVRTLASQYLYDDPYQASWLDTKRSLFDEAKMRFGGQLTLTEHRRCVPEIINFSNRIAYEPDGIRLDPVRQLGTDRLDPIRVVKVDGIESGATGSKVNHQEAEALVRTILQCMQDPAYDGLTFGVISLVGARQAQLIEGMLLERVPAEEWSARSLRCGDSAAFQGSERDVMFLSMVSGPEDGGYVSGALTHEMYVQRFNVAVSRARDQLWLFHSVDLNQFRNPQDLRYQLLAYCMEQCAASTRGSAPNPRVPDDVRVAPFDSLFEQRVYNEIVDRGFRVEPQVDASGYRIDLVVVGSSTRLAVECDGDAWHGPDAYERDLARQRELERCGWRFFRIRESSFYVDRGAALAGLWELLADLEIEPYTAGPDADTDAGSIVDAELDVIYDDADGGLNEPPSVTTAVVADLIRSTEASTEPVPSGVTRVLEDREAVDAGAQGPMQRAAATQRTPDDGGVSGDATVRERPLGEVLDEVEWPSTDEALAPYRSFEGTLPPATRENASRILSGVIEIVAVEGPVIGERIQQVYVSSSGDHRVGKQKAALINRALSQALRTGQLEASDPLNRSGLKYRTFTLPGGVAAKLRTLGPRHLDQVPPQELADIVALARARVPRSSESEMFRVALEMLGRKKLTTQAQATFSAIKTLLPAEQEDLDARRGLEHPQPLPSPTEDPDADVLEREFHTEMVEIHRRSAVEAGYNATVFLRMIAEQGGVETARQLVTAPTVSQGFAALWERGRLDLTVEHLVAQERFAPLFTAEEVDRARRRLADHRRPGETNPAGTADPDRLERADKLAGLLIESTTYRQLRDRAGRTIDDPQVRAVIARLVAANGRLPQNRLVESMGLSPTAAVGALAAMRRLLNVDGYEVLALDPATRTVRLDVGLMIDQFDLPAERT